MQLIIASNTVAEASRDVLPATGTPGWATDGNPAAGMPATDAPASHYNMMMAEIIQPILDAGLTLDGADWTQLSQAIKLAVATGIALNRNLQGTGWAELPGGLILQWGTASSASGGLTTVNFPIPYPTACFITLPAEAGASGTWPEGTPTLHGVYGALTASVAQIYSMQWDKSSNTWVSTGGLTFFWFALGY